MEVIMVMLWQYRRNGAGCGGGGPVTPLVWSPTDLPEETWSSGQNSHLERRPQVTAVIQAEVGVVCPVWDTGPDGRQECLCEARDPGK